MNLLKYDPVKLQSLNLKQRIFIFEWIPVISSILLVFMPNLVSNQIQFIYFLILFSLKYYAEGIRENFKMFTAGLICSILMLFSILRYPCYLPLKPGPYNIGYQEMTLPDSSIKIAIYYPTETNYSWKQKIVYGKDNLIEKINQMQRLKKNQFKAKQSSIEKFEQQLTMSYFNKLSIQVMQNASPSLNSTIQMIVLCPELGCTDSLYQFLIHPIVSQGFVIVCPLLDDIIIPYNYNKLQEFQQTGLKIFREQQILEREETIKEILNNSNLIAQQLNPKLNAKVILGIGKGIGANSILNIGKLIPNSILYEPVLAFLPNNTKMEQNVLFFRTKQYFDKNYQKEIKENQGRDRVVQWKNLNLGMSFVCGFYNLVVGNFSDLGLLNSKEQEINVVEMETLMQNQIAFLYFFLQIMILDESSEKNKMDQVIMKYMELYEKNLPTSKRKNLLFVDYLGKENNN